MAKDVRKRILDLLVEPSNVTTLKLKLGDVCSYGTVAYHLKELLEEGVVKKSKNNHSQGRSTTYSLNSKELIDCANKNFEDNKVAKGIILRKIKNNPLIEDRELDMFLERMGMSEVLRKNVFSNLKDSLMTIHYKITQKGLNVLYLEKESEEGEKNEM